jgi:hypothetical protein
VVGHPRKLASHGFVNHPSEAKAASLAAGDWMSQLRRDTVAVAILALATATLASADAATSDEGAEAAVGDRTDADMTGARAVTDFDQFEEDEVALAGFVTLSMNAHEAYAAIEGLSTVPGGISLGIGTPTEGTIAGINLGTTGRIVGNPTKAPPGSVTVTNATVISIDNGIAKKTTVTAPDSTTVTPAGVVSFNPGA